MCKGLGGALGPPRLSGGSACCSPLLFRAYLCLPLLHPTFVALGIERATQESPLRLDQRRDLGKHHDGVCPLSSN